MHLFDFLFPRRCLGCGRVGKYFCSRCVGKIRIIEQRETICPVCEKSSIGGATHFRCQTKYSIDGLTSFFHYDGIIQKAVKALKYRFVSDLASEFIGLIPPSSLALLSKLYTLSPKHAVFVPIPLHSARLRYRGFNQAEKLGKIFAQRGSISLCSTILVRTKATIPQVETKDRKQRLQNMSGVFSSRIPTLDARNSIILFDDVFTTGATMRAAANTLKREGAEFVWGITMAR